MFNKSHPKMLLALSKQDTIEMIRIIEQALCEEEDRMCGRWGSWSFRISELFDHRWHRKHTIQRRPLTMFEYEIMFFTSPSKLQSAAFQDCWAEKDTRQWAAQPQFEPPCLPNTLTKGPPTRLLPLSPFLVQLLFFHQVFTLSKMQRGNQPLLTAYGEERLILCSYFITLCQSRTPSSWRTVPRPTELLGFDVPSALVDETVDQGRVWHGATSLFPDHGEVRWPQYLPRKTIDRCTVTGGKPAA